MSTIKLDGEQQKQIMQDLKSREVSEDVLDKVAGGVSELIGEPGEPIERPIFIRIPKGIVTTMALGEEGNPPSPSEAF